MTEYVQIFTMVMQFVILGAVSGSAWAAWRTNKSMRRTAELIREYRREHDWLVARIEALEGRANGSKQRA